MQSRENIPEINSIANLSRKMPPIHKLDSHIKSNLSHFQGKSQKKYVHIKIHNSFEKSKDQNYFVLISKLEEQFNDKMELKVFQNRTEILSINYDDNELHYIIVPEIHFKWAEDFARQQRGKSDNNKKIYAYGIVKKSIYQIYQDKLRLLSKKKIENRPDYIDCFCFEDEDYPIKIVQSIEKHLQLRIRQEGHHIKTWAQTNKFAGKKVKKRTLHFYYEATMENELTGLYKTYKKKSKSSWIQIYKYQTFEDVLRKIRDRQVAVNKQVQIAKNVTSKILKSQSQIEPFSMKSSFQENITSQLNSSILSSSIRAINKLDQDDINIIICQTNHSQLQKFRALVRAQKYGNWLLWQINEQSSDFLAQLRDFLNEEAQTNQQLQALELQRIITSKTLFVLCLNTDDNTIDMFRNQTNVLHNMELLPYSDPDQFSMLLRQGVKSNEDFVVAVVPGGYRSFATEYGKVIIEFDAKYKNIDCVQNYKFISNANGRHISNISSSNALLGTQSNLTDISDNSYLQNIMRERDKHFHPFEGLKGFNVHLLIKETINKQLDGLREYVSNSPRLQISTYIDKEYLKRQIQTLTLKDSVLVITDDNTLREAQIVVRQFDEVCILNITARTKIKEEIKVISAGPKETIYELIKEIPEINQNLQNQVYHETTQDQSYYRKNRILPKKLIFRPGDTMSVRLPSQLKDIESGKMQIRLQKYFNQQIKIQYYKEPRDVRLVNKLQQPLSFIIWADSQTSSKEDRQRKAAQLEFFKDLAQNQIEELRQEFIVYSGKPKKFQYLTIQSSFQRFKLATSRWERIEQYIIGTYKRFVSNEQNSQQSIYSDQLIHVFFNDKDKASKDLIAAVAKRRDDNQLNAANHVQFHIMEDMETVMMEQSPQHKYYVVYNQNDSKMTRDQLYMFMNNQEYQKIYFKIILIRQQVSKKMQQSDERVRKMVLNEREAGEWLCSIKVLLAEFDYCIPHILIDSNSLDYYYFLDKYSLITKRFTFGYISSKENMKQQVTARKGIQNDQIWIIVKNFKFLRQYSKLLEKVENYQNVRFILQNREATSASKLKIVFRNQNKKQIFKFLLNIYRRDKRIFFPSSVGSMSSIALVIMDSLNGKPIAINRFQIANWKDIIKAKICYVKSFDELVELLRTLTVSMVYVVYPYLLQKAMTDLCNSYSNLKRVLLKPYPQYDCRQLKQNFVQNNNKIYIGTYGAQITDYLRNLRYNIRKSEQFLQKSIKNELIEINIQKNYMLSDQDLSYLTSKNDSVIVNRNGYQLSELNSLLNHSIKYNYLPIYVGDQHSDKVISDFNQKANKNIQFIDANASPLKYMMGDSKQQNFILETNEPDELTAFLYNLPENRYEKALKNRGKFVVYYNSNDINVSTYIKILKSVQDRNPRILMSDYQSITKISSKALQPGVILIHSLNERQYQDKVQPMTGVNYMIMSEQYNPDKNYASYGNKHFIGRQEKQFQNFMNQLAISQQYNIEPMQLNIDSPHSLIDSINKYNSSPAINHFAELTFWPPFLPKTNYMDIELIPVELKSGVLDTNPASLMKIIFPTADLPLLPLTPDTLNKIKNNIAPSQHMILKPGLDVPPSRSWFIIQSNPDELNLLPKSIPLPRPAPILKPNLAILLPNTPQFLAIGEMLKRNLEPDQFMITVIVFKSQRELEQYSKNNGQRLNSYDKIVVFLSNVYRKYDNNLRIMKSKLNNRMQYFIFDDNFHVINHNTLKNHLKPYRIRRCALPYKNPNVPRSLISCSKIVILVPSNIINNYLSLQSEHVRVIPYSNNSQNQPYLYEEDCFIIIVALKQDYHELKIHSKSRPRCKLVIDTTQQLPEDELYLFRIAIYSLYYGPNPEAFLKTIIPLKPVPPLMNNLKFLFYGAPDQQLVFQQDYDQYYKIPFRQWKDLYNYLMFTLRGKSNWLFKNSPGRAQILPLHPKVYLENKEYMKDFKNDFTQRGYLNKERVPRKSTLVVHEFQDLPQVYYTDEKELIKQLQKQQAPSVVLFNSSNPKMSQTRIKFLKHKWIGIINNAERWIDPEGILPQVQDERLKRKQDMFTNMFNSHVFDQFNDMQYYYLSNKATVDHERNIYFRTKEQLLSIYDNNPNLLMVVFVEDTDINHIPEAILAEASQQTGRVKLILLKINFEDDFNTLYIKYNEIDPVIKHINVVQSAGRIDFIVYNDGDGERSRQTLILKQNIKNFENQPYNNMMDVDQIARNIKGRFKKVYVICFPEEKKEIETIFNSYSIQNKGIANQGVQFILINRLSTIRLNPSHISNIRANKSRIQAPSQYSKSANKLTPENNSYEREANHQVKSYKERIHSDPESNINEDPNYLSRKNGSIEILQININIPRSSTVINPTTKMDSILVNKNFDLNIDEKLKGLFPVGKFFANKVNYFGNAKDIPIAEKGVVRLIISTQATPEIMVLSEQPQTLVIVVGKAGNHLDRETNALLISEDDIPSLIKKLEGSSVEGSLSNIRNLDSYSKVRVVYDPKTDLESKRRLLAASQKNKKIMPTVYKNVQQLKQYMQEPDSLLMLMMSHSPQNLEEAVAQQNKVIKKKKKIKMIVPRKTEFDIHGLETILEEDEGENENQLIKTLKNDQVDFYLKIYQNDEGERPQVILDKDWQGQKEQERDETEGNDPDYLTKLNLHSNIRHQILFRQQEIQKIKKRLNGDFIVVVAHSNKQQEVDEAVGKYNVLVQAYTNQMNLGNYLRDKKDNVTIAVIDRNMLSKIQEMKKKFPKVTFILESDNPHDQRVDQYQHLIAGQIGKMSDLQKIISDLQKENQKYRFNAEQVRAASRFGFKKTSIVDPSNHERLTIGVSNQKSKKVFLFYKQPDNNHVKIKLSDTFNNISFIPYKSVADFKRIVTAYNNYSSILIANGNDIPELQDFVSKKKEMIYVIRFNPPFDVRDNQNVKKLFSTFKRDELQKFLFDQFQRQSIGVSRSREKSKEKQLPDKYFERKKYTQKYQPNTFGTTPRFPSDYIPPKSKQSTYSRKYMKSNSRSKLNNNLNSRLAAIVPKSPKNVDHIKE